jgi:hypothetical protein
MAQLASLEWVNRRVAVGSPPIKNRLAPSMRLAFPVEKLSSLILRNEPFELFRVDERHCRVDILTQH